MRTLLHPNFVPRTCRTRFSARRGLLLSLLLFSPLLLPAQTLKFSLHPSTTPLRQSVRPQNYFDVLGRRAAFSAREDGRSEFWIFPFQIFKQLNLRYQLPDMQAPASLHPYAGEIEVLPERKTILFSHPLFTLKAHFIVPVDKPAGIILLDIDSAVDLTVSVSLLPTLRPMWPAGMGGQYAFWNQELQAYLISESRRQYTAVIGSPNAAQHTSPPAHALAEQPIVFSIRHTRELGEDNFYPIIITADFSAREGAIERYHSLLDNIEDIYRQTRNAYEDFFGRILQLEGTEFDSALRWNLLALHQGFIENPDLGAGLIAGFGPSGAGGRPGFGWFFGGDAFLNALAMLPAGEHDLVRRSIEFLQKYQRKDGKMMHELSQSAALIDWFEDYPYGYIHGDTTPLYLIAVHSYFRHSNDSLFVKKSWSSLVRAYTWCRQTDSNADGLMENSLAGLGASELGTLREKSGVDIFLAAAGVQAWWAFSELAGVTGSENLRLESLRWFETGRSSLEKRFWNEERGYYNFSLTEHGEPNPELSAWMAFPMLYDLLSPEHSRRAVAELASAKISTDWGSRMLSSASEAYDPVAYNNGAVWPFLTGFAIQAFYQHELHESGLQSLRNLANWLHHDALGTMPEIASGAYFRALETSVPHQLFSSSAFVNGLIRGLLGLRIDAAARVVTFKPSIPVTWDAFRLRNILVGRDTLSLLINQSFDSFELVVTQAPEEPIMLRIAPAFGPFAELLDIEGEAATPEQRTALGTTRFYTTMRAEIGASLRMSIDDPLRVWLPYSLPRPGDAPQQMRICRIEKREEDSYSLLVEGPGGSTRTLHCLTRDKPEITGGELLDDGRIAIDFEGEGYVRKWVHIRLGHRPE